MLKIKFKSKTKIIAVDKGKQIAYLNFHYVNDLSQNRNIEISYVYVKPKYRGQGIGSNLIQYLIKHKPKVVWISFWTGKEIEGLKMTDFYLKNGFKKLAYQADYYEKGIGTTLFARRVN